jgi:hypothetical protein
MTISTAARPIVDQHVFLLGRPPIGDFLAYVRTCAVNARRSNDKQLMDEWRAANDRVRELETSEAGLADGPAIAPLPPELDDLRDAVLAEPAFHHAFRLVPTELAMVELDRMVVHQKHINLMYVKEVRERLPAAPTLQDLFRFCIPLESHTVPVQITQTAPNSYTFVSPSQDFRFIEPVLLDPGQVSGYDRMGPVTALLGLVVGFGWNCVNAYHLENRLVLANGSHRAFALREMGMTHIPCVVQRITRRDELEITAGDELRRHPDRYLKSARPPMLKDYFDDRLRKVLDVVRKHRLLTLTFGVDGSDIPAQT